MRVLRFGMVHERGCEELTTTRDWIPLEEFSEEALDEVELRYCPDCLDQEAGHQPVSQTAEAADEATLTPLE